MIYRVIINNNRTITAATGKDGSISLDDKVITPDILEVRDGVFHVIIDNRSYNAEVIQHVPEEKSFRIRVNNNVYTVALRDKFDELLKALGMDNQTSGRAADLKAPMPGLVVEVAVSEGQSVQKGDKLVVLEAMKMENILKASADAIVKKINTVKGRTVEKNEVLIVFN